MRSDTEHLMSNPKNAARLREAIAQLEAGGGRTIDIAAGYERVMRRFPRIMAFLRDA